MNGKVSKTGYKKDSPDRFNDYNIVPSSTITMSDVLHDVIGIDDTGEMKYMKPGRDYQFKGKKVLELPMKKSSNLPVEVQDRLLALMELGGPILDFPIERMLDEFQEGGAKIKTVGKAAVAANEEQKIAKQYNFEGLPSITERNSWNDFLKYVGTKYPVNSPEAKTLNYGKSADAQNKFSQLTTEFNTQNTEALKQQYLKNSKLPGFDKSITQDQFIQSRQVTPEMMQNAQKFYGQQTQKDAWFGSETAQTFYPKISGLAQAYPNPTTDQLAKINAVAANKQIPIQVTPYGSTTASDYKGVATIKGYDAKGNPIIDYGTTKPYTPADSANIYFDPSNADATVKARFQPYLTPDLPTQERGGSTKYSKGELRNILGDIMKKKMGGEVAPQGMDTDTYVNDNKNYFNTYLKKNVMASMITDELNGEGTIDKNKFQEGGPFFPTLEDDSEVTPPPSQLTPEQEQQQMLQRYQATDLTAGIEHPFQSQDEMDAYNKTLETPQKKSLNFNASNAGTGLLAAMDVFSGAKEQGRAAQNKKRMLNALGASNIFGTVQGSKGDYDINNGMFKPNTTAAPSYKLGGTYDIDEKEIERLRKMGFSIKYVD